MEPLVIIAPLGVALGLLQQTVESTGWYDVTGLWWPFEEQATRRTRPWASAEPFTPFSAPQNQDIKDCEVEDISEPDVCANDLNPEAEPSKNTSGETEAVDQTCPKHTSQQAQDSPGNLGKLLSDHPSKIRDEPKFLPRCLYFTPDEWSTMSSVSRAHLRVVDEWVLAADATVQSPEKISDPITSLEDEQSDNITDSEPDFSPLGLPMAASAGGIGIGSQPHSSEDTGLRALPAKYDMTKCGKATGDHP